MYLFSMGLFCSFLLWFLGSLPVLYNEVLRYIPGRVYRVVLGSVRTPATFMPSSGPLDVVFFYSHVSVLLILVAEPYDFRFYHLSL